MQTKSNLLHRRLGTESGIRTPLKLVNLSRNASFTKMAEHKAATPTNMVSKLIRATRSRSGAKRFFRGDSTTVSNRTSEVDSPNDKSFLKIR